MARQPIKGTVMKIYTASNQINRLIGLVLLLQVTACTVAVQQAPQPVTAAGSFTLFLQPLPQETHRLTFTVGEIFALRADGSEILLPLQQNRFIGDNLIGLQKRIISYSLPPGRYQGIALRIFAADLKGEEGPIDLLPPKDLLVAEYPFTVRDKQTETLFLSLSADRLITDGAFFTPKFSLWKPERVLTNLKGFVTNSRSQSLTVFNKRTAQVLETIRIGKIPGDLALDQQRNWLYVTLAGENAIAVIEVNNGSILGLVRLRFGDEPSELALSADGHILLALNHGSNSVSIIDTAALFETGRVRLSSEPTGMFIDPDGVQAYVAQASSNSLAILDLQSQSVQGTVLLEESPLDGVVSADGQSLYLINDFSADLAVLDTASLAYRKKIFIGNGALSIKADSSTGLLYISKNDGEIAVVDPRAQMAIDSYRLSGPVQSLTIDNEENALFAVLPQSDTLVKLDLVSKKELGRLDLESGSQTVVVMGER